MKQKLSVIASSIYKASIELVFYSFLWLPLAFYSLSIYGTLSWIGLLLLSYSSFYFYLENRKSTHINVVLITLLNTIVIASIIYFQLSPGYNVVLFILIAIFTFVFTISGFRQYSLQFINSFPITFMALSFVGHVGLQIIKTVWLVELITINTWLYLFGVVSLILILFITNERMLADQQKLIGNSTAHQHALQMNRVLISVFSVIVISIILFRTWQEKMEGLIKQLLNWFLNLFGNGVAEESINQEPEQAMPQLPFGAGEEEDTSSWFIQMLEKAITVIAYIAFSAVIIGFLFLMFKLIKKLIHKLTIFLRRDAVMLDNQDVTFIDEIEEIAKSSKKVRRLTKPSSINKTKWSSMTLVQKCQYLYILFIRRAEQEGHQYINHLTVNEQIEYVMMHFNLDLSEDEVKALVYIYNEARYGLHDNSSLEVNEQQLQQLYNRFNKKK